MHAAKMCSRGVQKLDVAEGGAERGRSGAGTGGGCLGEVGLLCAIVVADVGVGGLFLGSLAAGMRVTARLCYQKSWLIPLHLGSAPTRCPACPRTIRRPSYGFAGHSTRGASDFGCIDPICPESPILCSQSCAWQFLFMGVFGTGTKAVIALPRRPRAPITGRRSFAEMWLGTNRRLLSFGPEVGASKLSGSAKQVHRRPLNPLSIESRPKLGRKKQ